VNRPARSIRILVADDHPVVRDGLAAVLSSEPDLEVVAQAGNGLEAVERYRASKPDVGVVDLNMPRLDGVGTIRAIRREFPAARLIVLTVMPGEEDVFRAFRAGASAYLLKDSSEEEILRTIRLVADGKTRVPADIAARLVERSPEPELTDREREVLGYLVQGATNPEIAVALDVSPRTVKAHVVAILEKLGAPNRTKAVAIALERRLVQPP
jgi:DNA-binding NarL/FixJ family response regulator